MLLKCTSAHGLPLLEMQYTRAGHRQSFYTSTAWYTFAVQLYHLFAKDNICASQLFYVPRRLCPHLQKFARTILVSIIATCTC